MRPDTLNTQHNRAIAQQVLRKTPIHHAPEQVLTHHVYSHEANFSHSATDTILPFHRQWHGVHFSPTRRSTQVQKTHQRILI